MHFKSNTGRPQGDSKQTVCQMLRQVGDVVLGTVQSVKPYGAFVDVGGGLNGLLHISQISEDRVANVETVFSVGDKLKVSTQLLRSFRVTAYTSHCSVQVQSTNRLCSRVLCIVFLQLHLLDLCFDIIRFVVCNLAVYKFNYKDRLAI
jgi:hypothetical protein